MSTAAVDTMPELLHEEEDAVMTTPMFLDAPAPAPTKKRPAAAQTGAPTKKAKGAATAVASSGAGWYFKNEFNRQGKIQFTDIIDVNALKRILHHWDRLVAKGQTFSFFNAETGDKDTNTEANKAMLTEYLKFTGKKDDKAGRHITTYVQKDNHGRYFPIKSQGLGSLCRKIRHTIAKKTMMDFDMSNCHPQLCLFLCTKNGMDAKAGPLRDYVQNRGDYLKLMQDVHPDIRAAPETEKRDMAKKTVLRWQYGGELTEAEANAFHKHQKLMDLYTCVRDINESLTKLYPDYVTLARAANMRNGVDADDNLTGRAASRLIQDFECKVLLTMVEYAKKRGVEVGTLAFDGFMVPRTHMTDAQAPEFMRYLEDSIATHPGLEGLRIKMEVKEMNEGLDLAALDKEERTEKAEAEAPEGDDAEDDDDYDIVKAEFEQTHFMVRQSAKYYTILPDGSYFTHGQSDFKVAYGMTQYTKGGKPRDFLKRWLKDPNMRAYIKTAMVPPPGECPADTYNLWTGFAVEKWAGPSTPEELERCERLVQRIMQHNSMLCNHDPAVMDYLTKWEAHLFQCPGQKPNVAILLKSNSQGVGKDFKWDITMRMLGPQFGFKCGKQNVERDILGAFNQELEGRLLVIMDEIGTDIGYKHNDALKNLISCVYDQVASKNVKQHSVPSFVRYGFLSNNEWPLKVECNGNDTERRQVHIDCRAERPPKEYFDELAEAYNDNMALRHYYDYLTNKSLFDASSYDWIKNRPVTETYKEAVLVSRPREVQFVIDYVTKLFGEHVGDDGLTVPPEKNMVYVTAKSLFDEFKSKNGTAGEMGPVKFALKLKRIMPPRNGEPFKARHARSGNVYEVYLNETIAHFKEQALLPQDWCIDTSVPMFA